VQLTSVKYTRDSAATCRQSSEPASCRLEIKYNESFIDGPGKMHRTFIIHNKLETVKYHVTVVLQTIYKMLIELRRHTNMKTRQFLHKLAAEQMELTAVSKNITV
jgi:hypothetical protein